MTMRDTLNDYLTQITRLRNNNKRKDVDVDMTNQYDAKEKFLFRISLAEFRPKSDAPKIMVDYSPKEVIFGYLSGNVNFVKLLAQLNYLYGLTFKSLAQIVTANIDKRYWYRESDLEEKGIIHTFVNLSLEDIREILHSIPNPQVSLRESEYNVQDPVSFLRIVNDKNRHNRYNTIDLVPYLRKQTLMDGTICSQYVYRLSDQDVQLIVFKLKNNNRKKRTSNVLNNHPYYIDQDDIDSLNDKNFVTNTIIDMALQLLIGYHNISYCISLIRAEVYTLLFRDSDSQINPLAVSQKNFLKAILIPVNIENSHWVLAIIEIESNTIRIIDSIARRNNKVLLKIYNNLKTALNHGLRSNHQTVWKFSMNIGDELEPLRQDNNHDCALFVLKNAERYIVHRGLNKNKNVVIYADSDTKALRKRLQTIAVTAKKEEKIE